jgi:hypothetical protein
MWRGLLTRLLCRWGMMLTMLMMVVMVSGRGVGLLGSLPGLLMDDIFKRWGGFVGLVLTHLW